MELDPFLVLSTYIIAVKSPVRFAYTPGGTELLPC